ncbi:zinc-dependent alcohol dehydrogenase [Anaeromicropila populeti]|uniref:(R,R)-butanediol dehydrogenase / meso-butanediol dehydrogenase / diacetyl reductase n=1 Tax=Anaeromicropila populeti TaxID=37658 RepID=A0A1I6L6A5_9FIRM|nr:alcohol dehydrogenase catalytic domain-containing protein [Anaeromicropila populeti]SFR98996.1 (R,R)-butanediol dehydrogenase / meso-butanediol dehydrogenase / diacetyl reductase [Anaeromicropila populeti]
MQGIVWTEDKRLELREMEEPVIKHENDVKVKIYGTGICGTDLNLVKGKMTAKANMIIGHEAVGTVVETGKGVTNVSVGDRVVIDPTQFCGKCSYCRQGLTCFCDSFDEYQLGIGAHGTFADYYVGEDRFIYKIPDDMSWDTAILIEPLTCVLNIVTQAKLKPEDAVLVIGSGPIGAICQLVCSKIAGVTVAVELNPYRREMSSRICDYAYFPDELTENEVHRINNGRKFDVIIDAVGNQMQKALPLAGKGCRLFAAGFDQTYEMTINTFRFLENGISLIGTGEVHQMTESAVRYASKLKGLDELVTKKIPLSKYQEAFDELLHVSQEGNASGTMKLVLLSNITD